MITKNNSMAKHDGGVDKHLVTNGMHARNNNTIEITITNCPMVISNSRVDGDGINLNTTSINVAFPTIVDIIAIFVCYTKLNSYRFIVCVSTKMAHEKKTTNSTTITTTTTAAVPHILPQTTDELKSKTIAQISNDWRRYTEEYKQFMSAIIPAIADPALSTRHRIFIESTAFNMLNIAQEFASVSRCLNNVVNISATWPHEPGDIDHTTPDALPG